MDRLSPVEAIHETLDPVYETVRRLASELPAETTLIGFAGAPWTVATYMIAGEGTKDQLPARRMILEDPETFGRLIDRITDATIAYLSRQIEAGAEVVKLFDSWAGSLNWTDFQAWCIEPNRRIVEALKARWPDLPVIGFPRGAGAGYATFARVTGVDAIAIDSSVDPEWAKRTLQPICTVQGNLDPLHMVTGGPALETEARRIVETLRGGGHIFNLGHGITPDADPANVKRLIEVVRSA